MSLSMCDVMAVGDVCSMETGLWMCVFCQVASLSQLDRRICQARYITLGVINVEDLKPGSSALVSLPSFVLPGLKMCVLLTKKCHGEEKAIPTVQYLGKLKLPV